MFTSNRASHENLECEISGRITESIQICQFPHLNSNSDYNNNGVIHTCTHIYIYIYIYILVVEITLSRVFWL